MNKRCDFPGPSASLDLDVLGSILAIADTGSMTVAADRVARTPAALSMQLKKLEEVLGCSLFTRSRKGMVPTSEGERLLTYARRMVDLNREALDAFRGPALEGDVSVGMIDDLGHRELADVLADFAKSHPGVTVTVVMASSGHLAPDFDKGKLDLTLLSPGCAVGRRETDRIIHREPLIWVGAEGGCARSRTPLPVALANRGCAWRRQTVESLEKSGREYRVAYVSDFDAAVLAAVSSDLAVAAMPASRVGSGIVALPASTGLPPVGTSEIALRVQSDAGPAALALADHIEEQYSRR